MQRCKLFQLRFFRFRAFTSDNNHGLFVLFHKVGFPPNGLRMLTIESGELLSPKGYIKEIM